MIMEPPPAMFSGYGSMTPEDMEKHPAVVMQEHESKLRTWCKGQTQRDLMGHMKKIAGHAYYDKFMSQFNNRMFGENGWTDLVEFDLWLKKCEISEKLGRARPVLPSPPSKVTAESAEPAKPTKPPKSTSVETSDSMPSLTPEEKEKYDDYWKQFKPSCESPAASPSGSVPSATTKTPDCKRRLDLGEGLRGCLCKCKYAFFWGHVINPCLEYAI